MFLRWLFKAEGLELPVDAIDWGLLAGMGSGAKAGLEAAGIGHYEHAVDACEELGTRYPASGAPYGLDDLVCFQCLSQHADAIHAQEFPPLAPPVLVSAVLGLKDPAPASGGLAVSMYKKTPARPRTVSHHWSGPARVACLGTHWHIEVCLSMLPRLPLQGGVYGRPHGSGQAKP